MTLLFSSPVTQVSAFFTYAMPLTLTAWDALDVFPRQHPVGVLDQCGAFGRSGLFAQRIPATRVRLGDLEAHVSGDAGGGSFVLDDLSFTPTALPVPEPATAALMASRWRACWPADVSRVTRWRDKQARRVRGAGMSIHECGRLAAMASSAFARVLSPRPR
jgi:hypothetical protein